MKRQHAGFAMIAVLSGAPACTDERRLDLEPQIYQAYGKTWVYRQAEIDTSNRFLAPLHAGGNGYREEHLLRVAQPTTGRDQQPIIVPNVIYALQKNGRYKQISCCQYYREQAELYNFENKLVLEFANARQFITDCFIYPSGHPDNERKPKSDQIFGTTVYGEFDPARKIFIVRTFDAGQFSSAAYKAQRADRSIASHAEFMYRHRKPFECT
jgi:hypothetical protein